MAEDIDIDANAAILVDQASGQVLYEKNADERAFPASITKIMTALLVAEHGGLSEVVTVSDTALQNLSAAGSSVGLKSGEQISVDNLLICMLVASANEAANVLAEYVAGSVDEFIVLMNKRAEELGCTNTHFVNAHGLHDEEHYTCARDVYLIAQELLTHPRLVEIVAMQKATIPATNLEDERFFFSTNSMLSPYKERTYLYKYTTGIKTGHTTPAGLCLASAATKGDLSLISIVLGAKYGENKEKGHFVESTKLFKWGFSNFKSKTILDATAPVGEARVRLAWDRDHVIASPSADFTCLVPNDFDMQLLTVTHDLPETINAPIEKGEKLGVATLTYDGALLGTVDLIAADTVKRSIILYIWDIITKILGSTLAKLLFAAFIVLLILYIIFVIQYNKRRRSRRYRGRRRR